MVMSGLTERRMRDKRFIRSEEVIIRAYSSIGNRMTVNNLLSRAQISRSTFYRHHRNLKRVLLDYEDYLLLMFKKTMSGWKDKKEVKFYFRQLLFFIIANKRMMSFLIRYGERRIFDKILVEFEPIIIKVTRLPEWAKTTLVVYKNELIGLLGEWAEDDFSETSLDKILDDMVYLSVTVKDRLICLDN